MSLLDTASLIVTPNGYKEGKLYSVIPSDGSGDLSVTRATTATRVNSAGLVELVPYNLFGYSEDFANAYWTKYLTNVTSNVITAPNGTTTADLFISTGSGYVYSSFISLSADVYTVSYYVKKNNTSWVALTVSNGIATDCTAWYNIDNQTLGNTSGSITITNRTIEDEGNGWLRLTLTISLAASGSFIFLPQFVQSNGSGSVNGDRGYIWGAQLVEGSVAKDYQKTETRLNIPRLDYSNGTCPSILVEPQRTNLALYSENFTTYWTNAFTTLTANYGISPEGIQNSTRFQMLVIGALQQTLTVNASTTYTVSFYCKLLGGTNAWLGVYNYNANNFIFQENLFSSLVLNEWVKITRTFTTPSGCTSITGEFWRDSTIDCEIYGFQLEAGSYATSYIPTTSASVTRNADVISKTGISSLIGQTEGTLFVDFNFDGTGYGTTNDFFLYVGDGANTDAIYIDYYNNIFRWVVFNGSTLAFYTDIAVTNGNNKLALGYKAGQYVAYANGSLILADTNATAPPTCSMVSLAQNVSGFGAMAKNIKATALWKTRLSNTQLAQLTTI